MMMTRMRITMIRFGTLILAIISMILVVVTLPFSLCYCVKVLVIIIIFAFITISLIIIIIAIIARIQFFSISQIGHWMENIEIKNTAHAHRHYI